MSECFVWQLEVWCRVVVSCSGHGEVDNFLLQAEDVIRDLVRSRGLGDVYKRQDKYS